MAYIIVKYGEDGEYYTESDAYSGYSCEQAGVPGGKVYPEKNAEALEDLRKLHKFNPSVYFDLVRVSPSEELKMFTPEDAEIYEDEEIKE